MPLPALKTIQWVTTDCYGTLIDWERGIIDAFKAEAAEDGFSFDEAEFIRRFLEVQAEVMSGSVIRPSQSVVTEAILTYVRDVTCDYCPIDGFWNLCYADQRFEFHLRQRWRRPPLLPRSVSS